MSKSVNISEVISLFKDASSLCLLGHLKPDGDAYGSTLGLGLSLAEAGKTVTLCNQDGALKMYEFMPGFDHLVQTPEQTVDCDLVVSLDTSTHPRLGERFLAWDRKVDVNIDHHISNTLYADSNFVLGDQPSTASIALQIIEEGNFPLSADSASSLFVGVSTDTGSFRYRGTTAETMRQAARLIEAGADSAELSRQCYQSMTQARFELRRLATNTMTFEENARLAYMELEPSMFESTGALPEDTEGLVESAQLVNSVTLAALFEHKADGSLKVSLRSKGEVNVSEIASEFGGGGHAAASGINFKSDSIQNRDTVLARLRRALKTS